METIIIDEKWAEITAAPSRALARKSDGKPVGTRARVLRTALDEWTEADPADAEAAEARERYRARTEALIAERYTIGQEIQFAREKDSAEGYAAYLAYVEECKTRARAEAQEGGAQ